MQCLYASWLLFDPKRRIKTIQNRTKSATFLGYFGIHIHSAIPPIFVAKNQPLNPVAGVPWSREAGVVGAVEIPFAGPSVCTALVLVGESQRSKRAAEKLGDATRAWCPPSYVCWLTKKT